MFNDIRVERLFSTLASSVTISSALEVEFVRRSLIPLSEPRVTLIFNFFLWHWMKLLVTKTLDYCQSMSPCLSSLLRLCYYNDAVIIKCPRPSHASHETHDPLSTIISKTVHWIVYNSQTINGLCTMNSKEMTMPWCIYKSCTTKL